MTGRRDFLSQPAPENYVAGLGRGATGFTTRSDIGPARDGPSEDQIKAAVARRSAQLGLTEPKDDDQDDDERYQDPDNEVGLFAGGIYEKDDEEADRIWKEVDEKMARRRQKQRLVVARFLAALWLPPGHHHHPPPPPHTPPLPLSAPPLMYHLVLNTFLLLLPPSLWRQT